MKQKLLLALLALFTLGGSNLFAQEWSASDLENGKYVFLNVGSGRYLGPGNSWGTQASLIECSHYNTLAKVSDGVYTIESQVSNGGTAYYFSGTYMDGAAVNVTIQDNGEGIFTMSTDGTYYGYDGSTTVLANNLTDPTSTNAQWKIMAYDDVYADASEENPIDVTYMILDSNFDRNNRNETKVADNNWTGAWTMNASNQNLSGGDDTNRCAESWRSTFTLSQAITVPNGYYKLRAQAALTEYTVTGADFPVVYATSSANTVTSPFNTMVNGESSMTTMSTQFTSGNYWTNYTNVITVSNKSLTIGVKGTRTDTWCIWDNFQLIYMGPIDLTEFANQLAAAVAAAEATEGTIPTAAYQAIAAVVEEYNKTYEDADAYSAAIVAINNAVSTYASADIVAAYSNYTNIRTAVLAVDGSIDVSEADDLANDGTDADLDDAVAAVRTALKNYLKTSDKTNVNLTDALLINPSFETGDFTGWTNNNMSLQTNTSFGKDGNVYCEKWQPNGTFSVSQTLTAMPAGVYQLTAKAKARGVTSAKLSAGGIEKAITIADSEADYTVEFAIDDNTDVTFKYEGVGTGAGSSWLVVDNFRLTLAGAGLPDVTAITGKMNAQVAAAQTTAIETYNANKTVANYNAAQAAIAAAQASVDAYAKMPQAITDATALKDAHNFVTAAATTTFAEAIAAAQNGYDNGTLTDAEANNYGNLGVRAVAWHNPREEADRTAAEAYMKSVDFGMNYNDWSVEGESDGSNFVVPFFEYWVSDANNLAAATKTATLTDLPNGLYSVQAWVRVRAKNETSATDATGITMDVNGGTAVDVTEGTQVGETQFQLATYEAEGLVKDGNLTVNFNIAADNNISWLSFQNVKYEKVRDLTPEEQAVTPTGITLDKTEVTLTATDNSVTLTPTFDPENATTTVTWTTSDANIATVADGVVTGVAPGTATITVASTLNADVKATCTVTVSYPETEVASDDYVNEGAKRTVVSYGDNLIKNGAFEYPNSFYGWTTGSGVAMSADNFELITEENNHYIKAKGHTGAGGVNSISTGWAIEAGKTYVFGYQVKSTSAGNSEFHVVSLTNELGNETSKISENSTAVGTDWTNVKYKFTNTDGYAYVQFRARWLNSAVSFDNFYLVEVVDEEVIGNVQYALDAIPTVNVGTGAFQYSQDAIDAANALVQGTATVEDVENAYAAVTTINAPAEGQLFNVVLTYDGWTYDNKAMTYIANGRTDGGNYNIQYKEEANQNLAQAFTFTKVEGNNYKMSQIDADGVARYISTGQPYGGNASQIRTTTNADDALLVTVIPTATEGKWNLRNTAANQFIGSQDAGVYTVNSHIDFVLQEAQKPSITINTTVAGWGTTILPFAAQKPADVKVYTCAKMNGTDLVLTEVETLEANKPYIIEGAWNEKLTGDAQGTELNYTEGLLTGVYAQTEVAAGTYVMQMLNGKVAFYQVSEEKPINVPANRAYLTVNSEAKVLNIGNGETNGINAIQALIDGDAEIFNVNGVKQNSLQKGINIIKMSNGETRKIMVK